MEQNFNNKFLFYNIVFTVLQIFLSAFILFFLYRLIINTVGLKQLGIWSLISTSITSLSILNYGFSGSLVKYVSKYAILGDRLKVKKLIETTSISVSVFSFFLSVVAYFGFTLVVKQLISNPFYVTLAIKILPICLLTFWFTILSSIYQATLEGLNLSYQKNIINIVSNLIILFSAFILLPIYGLVGLSVSYMVSSVFLLGCNLFFVKKNVPELSVFKAVWSRQIHKETFKYNSNYQIISIFAIFNEPVTKFIIVKYAGLELSGIYELVNKLVLQVRGIIVNVNQTLVPMYASFHEKAENKIDTYFKKSFLIVLLTSAFCFSTILFLSPLLSVWWFKGLNENFISYVIILSGCWLINTISAPAYFANLGSGDLRWNTISQVLMSILNVLLSLLFAYIFQPHYIILGWAISLSIASVIVIVKYNSKNTVLFFSFVKMSDFVYLLNTLILSSVGYYFIYNLVKENNFYVAIIIVLLYSVLQLVNFIIHPIFKELKSQIIKLK